MKKTFRTVALMMVLGTLAVSCQYLYTIDTLRTLSGRASVNASTEFTVSTNSDIARRDVCYWDPKEFNYGSLASGFVFNVDANINN